MNRFYVPLNVVDLDASIRFYSELGTRWESIRALGEATTCHAVDVPRTDGAACTSDPKAMKPEVDEGGRRCAPPSGCC